MHFDRLNKKNNDKALKVLGHDPSTSKLESILGEDKEVIERELQRTNSGGRVSLISESTHFKFSTEMIIASASIVVIVVAWLLMRR